MKYIKTYETYEAVEWNKNINWNYVKKILIIIVMNQG